MKISFFIGLCGIDGFGGVGSGEGEGETEMKRVEVKVGSMEVIVNDNELAYQYHR